MSEKIVSRRNFMKSTLVSVTGLPLFASNVLRQEEKIEEKGGKKRKFIYRTMGKTRIKLPVISMGGEMATAPALFRAALDSGINHLETNHIIIRGKNEEMIGESVKGRPRDSYFITTQIGFPQNMITGGLLPQANEGDFLKRLDISLKRLGLDYVDFLCFHNARSRQSVLDEKVLNVMGKAKKDGKVRFAGASCHRNEPEVIQACTDSKFYDFVMTSYNFRQKHYLEVREAIARAAQAGLGIIAFKVMGGTADLLRPVNASAALKWVLQDPNVHTITPGISSFDHLNIDLAVMEDLSLTDSEKDYLQREASLPGLYCQGCGQCVKQCVAKFPIPDLMRAYMYTYGYRKPAMAQELVVSLGLPLHVCEDCGQCPVKCSIGFDVPGKIRDVARLRDVPPEFLA
jgi:predicted aldo/keto reductase-like oxidoreductase